MKISKVGIMKDKINEEIKKEAVMLLFLSQYF
jgi:hypothetical protein